MLIKKRVNGTSSEHSPLSYQFSQMTAEFPKKRFPVKVTSSLTTISTTMEFSHVCGFHKSFVHFGYITLFKFTMQRNHYKKGDSLHKTYPLVFFILMSTLRFTVLGQSSHSSHCLSCLFNFQNLRI